MAKPGRATQEKRNRERAQKERHEEKLAERLLRKEQKKDRLAAAEVGIDPDLIGIVAGPQSSNES